MVVSVTADKAARLEQLLLGKKFQQIGQVTSGNIAIDNENWGEIAEWKEPYDTALGKVMEEG